MEPNSKPFQPPPSSLYTDQMASSTAAPPPSDRRARRRRTRDVSSRYMTTPSPATASSSSSFADENNPSPAHNSEKPLLLGIQTKPIGTQRKRIVRLFHDNSSDRPQQQQQIHHHQHLDHPKPLDVKLHPRMPRAGTPIVYGTPRLNLLKSVNLGAASGKRIGPPVGKPELASLARTNPFAPGEYGRFGSRETSPENSSTFSDTENCSISSQGGFCESPPLNKCRARTASEFRSSMPEADLLPSMTARWSVDRSSGRQEQADDSSSVCCHSLSSSLSNCPQLPFNPSKSILYSGAARTAGHCLPPQSQNTILGMDSRKGRKSLNRQEDVHSLRLLHNYNLQWRFVNAKAQAAVHALTIAAEKSLYGASANISGLRNSVSTKRTEFERLKREGNISTIIEAQMPYLIEWVILEEEYSSSLSGAIKALQGASLRLPVIGNVRVDIREIKEVLDSATNMLEVLSPCVGRFMPQAEGMEDVIKDLAKLVSREKTLIEECGDLLYVAHKLQVKESSLRSQLMQQHNNVF